MFLEFEVRGVVTNGPVEFKIAGELYQLAIFISMSLISVTVFPLILNTSWLSTRPAIYEHDLVDG
jgi:hypothetical protein